MSWRWASDSSNGNREVSNPCISFPSHSLSWQEEQAKGLDNTSNVSGTRLCAGTSNGTLCLWNVQLEAETWRLAQMDLTFINNCHTHNSYDAVKHSSLPSRYLHACAWHIILFLVSLVRTCSYPATLFLFISKILCQPLGHFKDTSAEITVCSWSPDGRFVMKDRMWSLTYILCSICSEGTLSPSCMEGGNVNSCNVTFIWCSHLCCLGRSCAVLL